MIQSSCWIASCRCYSAHVALASCHFDISTVTPRGTPTVVKEHGSELTKVTLTCLCIIPVFDNPVVHIITTIAYSQHTVVQLVSTAVLIVIHTTGVELKLVA